MDVIRFDAIRELLAVCSPAGWLRARLFAPILQVGDLPATRQGTGGAGSARRARALRRLRARRSSADSPPQTPSSWRDSMAQLRQASITSHRRQTAFASSIWRSAGPVFPIGKKSSGSSSRQAARSRHVIRIELLESRTGVSMAGGNSRGTPRWSLVSKSQHPSQRQRQRQVNGSS